MVRRFGCDTGKRYRVYYGRALNVVGNQRRTTPGSRLVFCAQGTASRRRRHACAKRSLWKPMNMLRYRWHGRFQFMPRCTYGDSLRSLAHQSGDRSRTTNSASTRKMGVSNGIQWVRKIFERRIEKLVSSHGDTAPVIIRQRPNEALIDEAGGTRLEDARPLAEQVEYTA